MTLTEFLEARIAEDEDHATDSMAALDRAGLASYGARVLAECEAKRRIVSLADEQADDFTGRAGEAHTMRLLGDVVKALALPYADHPDYLAEWAL